MMSAFEFSYGRVVRMDGMSNNELRTYIKVDEDERYTQVVGEDENLEPDTWDDPEEDNDDPLNDETWDEYDDDENEDLEDTANE